MSRIICIYILLFLNFFLFSQKQISLNECIDIALKNNIQIKQDSLSIKISDENLAQSKAMIFPSLNGNINHAYNFGQVLDPYTNQFASSKVLSDNLGIGSSIILFNGFRLQNLIKKDKFTKQASLLNYENSKFELKINICANYLQILMLNDQKKIIESRISEINNRLYNQNNFFDVGRISKQVILELEIQKKSKTIEVLDLEKQIIEAYLKLKQQIGVSLEEDIIVLYPKQDSLLGLIDLKTKFENIEKLILSSPKYKSLEFELLSSQYNLKSIKGTFYPKIAFNTVVASGYSGLKKEAVGSPQFNGYQTIGFTEKSNDLVLSPLYNSTTRIVNWETQLKQNLNYSLGFSVSIPIFNGLSQSVSYNKAKIDLLIKQNNIELTKVNIRKSLLILKNEISTNQNKILNLSEVLEAQKELLKIIETKYAVGAITNLDYQIEEQKVINLEHEIIALKYELLLKNKIIEYY
jgi:outer membrane protein